MRPSELRISELRFPDRIKLNTLNVPALVTVHRYKPRLDQSDARKRFPNSVPSEADFRPTVIQARFKSASAFDGFQ